MKWSKFRVRFIDPTQSEFHESTAHDSHKGQGGRAMTPLGQLKLLSIFAFGILLANTAPHAAWSSEWEGRWPTAAKDAYVTRCASTMSSQGLPLGNARLYCRCFVDGAEREFGAMGYDAMMRAQPNPGGSEADRRLYRVLMACSDKLP